MSPPSFLWTATVLVAFCCAGASATSTKYTLAADDTYADDGTGMNTGFFDKFDFFTANDLSNGYVDYQSQASASSLGLIKTVNGEVQMLVDSKTDLTNSNGRGRASVRIQSKKIYNGGLFIADITHMPGGQCGIWPAWWTLGVSSAYPIGGEIDIIENIDLQTHNLETLHTTDGCKISASSQGGTLTDEGYCSNTYNNPPFQYSNQGCSVRVADGSFGVPFNSNGGGVYAMEWTPTSIKMWNWPRSSIPGDITNGQPDPSTWGPATFSAGDECNIGAYFVDHKMAFNTNFCGDFVNALWQYDGCYNPTTAPNCESYVKGNPGVFAESFWSIKSVKVYQKTAVSSTSSSSSVMSSTSTSSSLTTSLGSSQSSSSGSISTTSSSRSTSISSLSGSISTASSSRSTPTSSFSGSILTPSPSSLTPTSSSSGSASVSGLSASGVQMTTSIVYTTMLTTITRCPSTVTNCPFNSTAVVVSSIALYTTICPVSAQTTPASVPTIPMTTSIVYATNVITVTACPPSVPNCPANAKVTSVVTSSYALYTTICPVTASLPSPQIFAETTLVPPSVIQVTTPRVYATEVITVTVCPPSVPNCPESAKVTSVVTSSYALYTTVRPTTTSFQPPLAGASNAVLTQIVPVVSQLSPSYGVKVANKTLPAIVYSASAAPAANSSIKAYVSSSEGFKTGAASLLLSLILGVVNFVLLV